MKSFTILMIWHIEPNIRKNREVIKQKGICPYNSLDWDDKLVFQTLPERKDFDTILRNEDCSEDYARAQRVWRVFDHKQFDDYLSL